MGRSKVLARTRSSPLMSWEGVKVSCRLKRSDWCGGIVKIGEVGGAGGWPVKVLRWREISVVGEMRMGSGVLGVCGFRVVVSGPLRTRRECIVRVLRSRRWWSWEGA